jgi:hypothetical protein
MTITAYGLEDKFQKFLTSTTFPTSQDTFLQEKYLLITGCILSLAVPYDVGNVVIGHNEKQ